MLQPDGLRWGRDVTKSIKKLRSGRGQRPGMIAERRIRRLVGGSLNGKDWFMACIAWHRDRLDACTSFSFVYSSAQHEVLAACGSSRIWPGFTGPTCTIDQQAVSSPRAYMYSGSKVAIIDISGGSASNGASIHPRRDYLIRDVKVIPQVLTQACEPNPNSPSRVSRHDFAATFLTFAFHPFFFTVNTSYLYFRYTCSDATYVVFLAYHNGVLVPLYVCAWNISKGYLPEHHPQASPSITLPTLKLYTRFTAMQSVKTFALTSVPGSVLLVRQVPRLAIANSYIWTASVLFLVQLFVFAIWKVILYPRFFSPLRHLPQPKVSRVQRYYGYPTRLAY